MIFKLNLFLSIISTILISILINEINTFKCIADKLSVNPGILNIKQNRGKRIFEEEDEEDKNYTNIKIGLDFTQFDQDSSNLNLDVNKISEIKRLINETIEAYQKILLVNHDEINLTEIKYAESIIKSRCELKEINSSYGDFLIDNDVIIFPTLNQTLNDSGNDVLAAGKFCLITTEYKVIGGNLNINPYISFNKTNSDIYFKYSLFHELTHILIFHPVLLKNLDMVANNSVISETVIKKAKEHYNCKDLKEVKLEGPDDNGVEGYHWDSRYMLGDYMISKGYIDFVISDITLALFEDSGFYKVNYYTGGLFKFGKNKGCAFTRNEVHNENISFENEFCNKTGEPVCTQSKVVKASCNNYTGDKEISNYFVPYNEYNNNDSYFSQSCRYGNKSINETDLKETFGKNSFCFVTNLSHKEKKEINKAACFEISCNHTQQNFYVYIEEQKIECFNSSKITLDAYNGYFICPKYNDVCQFNNDSSICNELFDCIEQGIEVDNYTYDYNIYKFSGIIQLNLAVLFIIIIILIY